MSRPLYHHIQNQKILDMFEELKEVYLSVGFFDPVTKKTLISETNENFYVSKTSFSVAFFPRMPFYMSLKNIVNKYIPTCRLITVLQAPAGNTIPWHNDGTEYFHLASEEFKEYNKLLRFARRNASLNFNLTGVDLSSSMVRWSHRNEQIEALRLHHYTNMQGADDIIVGDTGLRIRVQQDVILNNPSLLEESERLYGMSQPMLLRTDEFHEVDNSECGEDRTTLTLGFNLHDTIEEIYEIINNLS